MPTVFPSELMHESVWLDRQKFVEAEEHYHKFVAINGEPTATSNATSDNNKTSPPAPVKEAPAPSPAVGVPAPTSVSSPLINEITTMRANIKSQLESMGSSTHLPDPRVAKLEEDNKSLRSLIEQVSKQLADITLRVGKLEAGAGGAAAVSTPAPVEQKSAPAPAAVAAAAADDGEDDDDFDLFADDDDEEEEEETAEEIAKREALLAKYHEKKSKKPALIAKSNIVLDVKPWDDETDMEAMEQQVRTIEMDGLVWGGSKLVEIAFGIRKLQISCVVEDDKVGSDILSEKITEFEDYVQSVDVASFNKV